MVRRGVVLGVRALIFQALSLRSIASGGHVREDGRREAEELFGA
jgi:hypothetical protein